MSEIIELKWLYMVKHLIALPLSWILFSIGHLASYPMNKFDECGPWVLFWYRIYQWTMVKSTEMQDWAAPSVENRLYPWGELINELLPNWASPPGDSISCIMEERDMDIFALARELGIQPDRIEGILSGLDPLDAVLAARLESIGFGPSQFWLSREKHYREDLERINK